MKPNNKEHVLLNVFLHYIAIINDVFLSLQIAPRVIWMWTLRVHLVHLISQTANPLPRRAMRTLKATFMRSKSYTILVV